MANSQDLDRLCVYRLPAGRLSSVNSLQLLLLLALLLGQEQTLLMDIRLLVVWLASLRAYQRDEVALRISCQVGLAEGGSTFRAVSSGKPGLGRSNIFHLLPELVDNVGVH